MEQSGDPLADLANNHWGEGHITTLSEQADGEVWVVCYDCNMVARRLTRE